MPAQALRSGCSPGWRATFPNQTRHRQTLAQPIRSRPRRQGARWKEGLKRLGSAPKRNREEEREEQKKKVRSVPHDEKPASESRFIASKASASIDRCSASDFPSAAMDELRDAIFDGSRTIVQDFSEAEQSALLPRQGAARIPKWTRCDRVPFACPRALLAREAIE